MRILLRFRLGAHSLPVVMGRRTGTPRAQRLCQQCDQHAVGDERHMESTIIAFRPLSALLCKLCVISMLHCLPMVHAQCSSSCGQLDITGVAHFVMDCFDVLDDIPSNQP